jgi:prepilin-type N-terminal cleavage/methylation domain-containing protein
MVPKYMILKVITQNFSKINKVSKGFTLIELIIGLSIMLIIGGLAMDALIQASISFNKDKKSIDSSQSMSAILEIIGSDIKQSGENINDAKFPVIKIEKIPTPNPGDNNMPGSSKITIRRALTTPLTLCEEITSTSTNTTLTVTDDSLTEPNCKLGTEITVGTIIRPTSLKEARNKRCQLDDVNGNYTTPTTSDFCEATKASPDKEKVLAAMSDEAGNMRTFQYVDDTSAEDITFGSPPVPGKKYKISILGLSADSSTYEIGDPIYLVEERVYSLDKDGNFMLQIDGGVSSKLMKKIQKFNVSTRVYGDKETRETDAVSNIATPAVKPNLLPLNRRCDSSVAYYICEFNSIPIGSPAGTPPTVDDWKTIQGIKVELQAKYDGTGQSATASTAELEKLSSQAEFFPRNVLSK